MIRFLVDAQLPQKVVNLFREMGYDTLHTLDLPDKNMTKDSVINTISCEEKRVVISKDRDFVESLLISNKPYKLLFVNTGNIHNRMLAELLSAHIAQIVDLFEVHRLIEITQTHLIVHE